MNEQRKEDFLEGSKIRSITSSYNQFSSSIPLPAKIFSNKIAPSVPSNILRNPLFVL